MPKAVETSSPASFEAALTELEAVVQAMEDGRMSLEESLAAYRRGTELMNFCQHALAAAEQQVSQLENETLREFRPGTIAD